MPPTPKADRVGGQSTGRGLAQNIRSFRRPLPWLSGPAVTAHASKIPPRFVRWPNKSLYRVFVESRTFSPPALEADARPCPKHHTPGRGEECQRRTGVASYCSLAATGDTCGMSTKCLVIKPGVEALDRAHGSFATQDTVPRCPRWGTSGPSQTRAKAKAKAHVDHDLPIVSQH